MQSLRLRLLLVAPLRLGLSVVWLVAARAAGSSGGAVLLAFAAGAFATAFLAGNDPRARFLPQSAAVEQLPAEASLAPVWRHAADAAMPSTVGVSLLAAVTLAFEPTLSALCGGILAGLGLAALLRLRGVDPALYLDPRRRAVFRK